MSSHAQRISDHSVISAALARQSDLQLRELVSRCERGRVGIGGLTHTIEVSGKPVFVKLVAVTDVERAAGPECTGNLFVLPTWYQYGVGEGSTGFNVWREVTAQQSSSAWVRNGDSDNFPLLYHWRELPRRNLGESAIDPDSIERAVRFWGNLKQSRHGYGRLPRHVLWSRCFWSMLRSRLALG
ncbi:hypothetical protein [Flexivirga sp. B27]